MGNIVYIFIGWVYLWIRYRNKNKVNDILNNKYEGNYLFVGAELILSIFGILLIILLITFLIIIIGRFIYDLIN